MKSLQKMLAEQKKQQTNNNLTLENVYKDYGEALFEYVLKNGIKEDNLFFTVTDTWKNLKEKRTAAVDSIVTMKAALARQKEVEQFYHESEKMLTQCTKRYRQLQEKFAIAFFSIYEHDESLCFLQDIKEKILPLEESAKKIEEQQIVLGEQKKTSSAIKKLLINSQLTLLGQKLCRINKTKDKQVIDNYTVIATNTAVKAMYEQNLFEESLAELYASMKDAEGKLHETEVRKRTLADEKEKLEACLHEHDEVKQPKKSIAELNDRIKIIDAEMVESEKKYGKKIADLFCTEDGVEKETDDFENNTDELQDYAKRIIQKRRERAQNSINIAYLENVIAIKQAEAACEGLINRIQEHKQNITRYENMIVGAEKTIAEKEAYISTLIDANAELKPDDNLLLSLETE